MTKTIAADRCFAWQGEYLRLHARVIPRSSRSCIGEVANGRLRIHLHAPPSNGRANEALIRLIARAFGVPRSAVTITGGARARNKTLRIDRPGTLPPGLR